MSRYPRINRPERASDPAAGDTALAVTPRLPMPQWLIDRRRAMMLAGAAALVAAAGPLASTPAVAKPGKGRKFFTNKEFALLDEFAEMIIPKDERSGGARAAKVAEHIDRKLGEIVNPPEQQSWRDDLAEIDRLSRLKFGRTFVRARASQREQLLTSISRNERKPSAAGEFAFGTIKWWVSDFYYRTKIGIHDELRYQGNVIQDEFIGTDISGRPPLPDTRAAVQPSGAATAAEIKAGEK